MSNEIDTIQIKIKPYTTKELSELYRVDRCTLHKWLTPFKEGIGVRIGYYYTCHQVEYIFEKIGYPMDIEI